MSARRTRGAVAAGLFALVLGAPGLGCGKASSPKGAGTVPPGSAAVTTADFKFAPKELRVRAGARVAWTNRGQTTHTVKGPGFFSQALDPGKTYRHRFTRPGRYPYLCTLHPTLMKGTIVVG